MNELESTRNDESAVPTDENAKKPEYGQPPVPAQPHEPRSIADGLRDFIGILDGFPPDFARNHDHYLYGTPKK
jgi:hypothetical protein